MSDVMTAISIMTQRIYLDVTEYLLSIEGWYDSTSVCAEGTSYDVPCTICTPL